MYPDIIVFADSDHTKKVVLSDAVIVKEDSMDINQGGGIDESGISAGTVTIQVDGDSWDDCIALNDTLLVTIDLYFGGKIDMQTVERDIDKRIVKFSAYGWLDYAEDINNLDSVYLDPRRWGNEGELKGSIPLFFPNLEASWASSFAEKFRTIKFLRNDMYKTKKPAVLTGEHTVIDLQKKGTKWGFALNDVPDAPEITWYGSFGGVAVSTTHWRAVVRIPKNYAYKFEDFKSGATITVQGTDDFDGDYTFRYVISSGSYQQLMLDEQFKGSEKTQPTGWLDCRVGAKIWLQDNIRFEISERWDINITIEQFIRKCMTQLGIPVGSQYVDIDVNSSSTEPEFSLLARGLDEDVFVDDNEKRTAICVNGDHVWFGVEALSLYKVDVGMFYSSNREFLYSFNDDSANYDVSDQWYGNSYGSTSTGWLISKIFQVISSELWIVLDHGGTGSSNRKHAVVCLDVSDTDNIYCKAVADYVDAGTDSIKFAEGACELWKKDDTWNYIVSLYLWESGGTLYEKLRFVCLNNYLPTESSYSQDCDVWSAAGEVLTDYTKIGRGSIDSTDDIYVASRWDMESIYEIDLDASFGSVSATYNDYNYTDNIYSVQVAPGESVAMLNSVYGEMVRLVIAGYLDFTSQDAAGTIGYSTVVPGEGTSEKRFYCIEDTDIANTIATRLITYETDGTTDKQLTLPSVYAAYGAWASHSTNYNLYTFVYIGDMCSLAQLGTFEVVFYRPNFSGQNLREILTNLADMCNCWVWIAWDRSEAYFYSKKKNQNVVNLTDEDVIGTPEWKPYVYSEVDYIDMGEWSYPDYEAYPWSGETINTHSVYGDYITNGLLAESIGKNWKDWLDRYIGELSIEINYDSTIKTGTRITWNGAYWLVLNVSIDIIKSTMRLECVGYHGEETT